jgi:hypothetical protein
VDGTSWLRRNGVSFRHAFVAPMQSLAHLALAHLVRAHLALAHPDILIRHHGDDESQFPAWSRVAVQCRHLGDLSSDPSLQRGDSHGFVHRFSTPLVDADSDQGL